MNRHSPCSRAGSLALLGFLLAVASAQSVLEARETAASHQAAVEQTHQSGCLRLHDHRFCILSGRSPWSPTQVQARGVAAPLSAEPAGIAAEERPAARAALYSPQPRSPPTRS